VSDTLIRNAIISILCSLVLPTFVAVAVIFAPLDPPGAVIFAVAFSPLVAVFFGHAARKEIRKIGDPKAMVSRVAAIGTITGYLGIVLMVLFLFTGRHSESRMVAYEASAVGSLRTLNLASHAYASAHPQVGFPKTLKDLTWDRSDPGQAWGVDETLASGVKTRYRFTYVPKNSESDGPIDAYQIFADPLDLKDKDLRHFFSDQSGAIRISTGAPANESSTELK
jgi:hypothetical protein